MVDRPGERRFDGETARWILERAALEQQRLTNELAGSYTFEELEEIAAEAGISVEALRAAASAHARRSRPSRQSPFPATSRLADDGPPHRRTADRRWSAPVKGIVLTTAGVIAFAGFMLAFPALAHTVLWALLAFLVLVAVLAALGATPF